MADRQLISRDELRMNFLKHLQAQDHCEGISDIQVVPLDARRDGGEMWAVTNPRATSASKHMSQALTRSCASLPGSFN